MNSLKAVIVIFTLYFLDWHLLFVPNAFLNTVATHRSNQITYSINFLIVKSLPFNLESTDKSGNSPLVYAVYYNNDNFVDFLLENVSCEHAYSSLGKLETEQITNNLIDKLKGRVSMCKDLQK